MLRMVQRCGPVHLITQLSIWIDAAVVSAMSEANLPVRMQQLIAGNGTRDYFGYAVSTSGSALAVGAWKHDLKGAAFVFHRDYNGTWTLAQRLVAPNRTINDQFGCAVSLMGDILAIGANRDDERGKDSGAVYLFHRTISSSTWLIEQKLTVVGNISSNASMEDSRFGTSVALNEDSTVLVVGAYRDSFSGPQAGSVYVFQHAPEGSFSFEQRLSSADSATGDRFGWAVSVSGNRIAVGAPRNGPDGPASGAVYIFQQHRVASSWELFQKIIAADGIRSDNQFGISVSLWQDILAVGSHLDSHNGLSVGAGSVYIFRFENRWAMVQKLMAMDSGQQDRFGISVSLRGTKLAVGAYLDDDQGQDTGSAYLFEQNGKGHWLLEQKFTGPTKTYETNFGRSVAIPDNDDVLIVGSSGRNPSTYVWGRFPDPPTTTPRPPCEFGDGYCRVCAQKRGVCFHGFGWGLCADEAGQQLQYRVRLNVASHQECAEYAANESLSTGFVHTKGWGPFAHECRIYGPALSGLLAPDWDLHAANGSIISKSVPATGADAEGIRKWLCFRRDHLAAQSCTVTAKASSGLHSMPCKGGSEIAHGAACVTQCAAPKQTPSIKVLRCHNGTIYPSASDLYCTGSRDAELYKTASRSWWYSFLSTKPNVAGAQVYYVLEVAVLIAFPKLVTFFEHVDTNTTFFLLSENVRRVVPKALCALWGLPEQALEVLQYRAAPGGPPDSLRVEVRITPPMPLPDESSFRDFAAKFRNRTEQPHWVEGQYRGAKVLMAEFAEVGAVLLDTSSVFLVLKAPEQILCDESQEARNSMGYYTYFGCQTRTISGRRCEWWSDHAEQLKEGSWQLDRAGGHRNCRNPDGRETGRPLVGGSNPWKTGSKHIWCLARDAPGEPLTQEFCMPLAFRAPVLCKAPLMAMAELGGETMPFVVFTTDSSGKNQEWMAPGDVERRERGCYQMNPDFLGEISMHCSEEGKLHVDVSKCEDTVFDATKGSVGLPGLTPPLKGLTVGGCRRHCLELRGACQAFEYARRQEKTGEDDVNVATFSQSKIQVEAEETTFCTLYESITEIRSANVTDKVWVYRLVGTPVHWPQVQTEGPTIAEEEEEEDPLPTILGVVAALVFSGVVLWFVRRYCNISSILDSSDFEEPEKPEKPAKVAPEKPLKCSYCGRGFNTYPALTVHQRRCENEFLEAERIRKESRMYMSPVERLMDFLGIYRPIPKERAAHVREPTLVKVGSPSNSGGSP